jgi:hypothetical protein
MERFNLNKLNKVPLYPQKLALTSPTSSDRSVGIVRSRTKATELEKREVSRWGLK